MAISQTTGFDPAVHGFHFENRFSGLHIVGAFNVGLGNVAEILSENAGFWKGWGLCGGMSWMALDRFYAGDAMPAAAEIPESSTDLFSELVDRQIDSFLGVSLITRCLNWQSRSERLRWWDPRNTTWKLTMQHWPSVKASIDHGRPASLTLIRTATNPSDNHQVLGVAYCEDSSGMGQIDLYDPNHPNETPTITLRLDGPEAGRAVQSSGERLRGFFVWPYIPESSPT